MRFVCLLLLVLSTTLVLGQGVCSKDRLVGKWTAVCGLPLKLTNIDSALALLDTVRDRSDLSIFDFKEDGKYDVWEAGLIKGMNSDTTILEKRKGHYAFVEGDCDIWFGRKPHRGQVWHILLLNEHYLVFRYRNPKTELLAVYKRQ